MSRKWSCVRRTAAPPRHSTARQSPRHFLDTSQTRPRPRAAPHGAAVADVAQVQRELLDRAARDEQQQRGGAIRVVDDENELADRLASVWTESAESSDAQVARRFIETRRGATRRQLDLLKALVT